ncbi:hypothetical protein DdX_14951 [Ditylenchus destructor]|uniref:Uncharacterized protein n=1 Tax=Ditylenchus destructor TaxID=166010 RepID=A0AAD4MRX5_9BILA|nr:hypothetical protein DdX_14951 [Ditylenchus destructor]
MSETNKEKEKDVPSLKETTETPKTESETPAATSPEGSPPQKKMRGTPAQEEAVLSTTQSSHSSSSSDSEDDKEGQGYMNDPQFLNLWKAEYEKEGNVKDAKAIQDYLDHRTATGEEESDEEGDDPSDVSEDEIPLHSEKGEDDD